MKYGQYRMGKLYLLFITEKAANKSAGLDTTPDVRALEDDHPDVLTFEDPFMKAMEDDRTNKSLALRDIKRINDSEIDTANLDELKMIIKKQQRLLRRM